MAIIENMILNKLHEYREVANRDRFILPEEAKIDVFIDIMKECVKFF